MINFNFGILNLLSKYIENKFTSHKQHLFCLLFSESPKKTHTDQSIPQVLLLSEKKRLRNAQKYSNCEKSFLQCLCYWYNVLRSIRYFYSMWQLEDNVFYKISLPCSCVMFKWFEISPHFNFYLRNTNTKAKSTIQIPKVRISHRRCSVKTVFLEIS